MILRKIVEYTMRYLRKAASSDEQLMELKGELKESLAMIILIRPFKDMRSLVVLQNIVECTARYPWEPVLMNN